MLHVVSSYVVYVVVRGLCRITYYFLVYFVYSKNTNRHLPPIIHCRRLEEQLKSIQLEEQLRKERKRSEQACVKFITIQF